MQRLNKARLGFLCLGVGLSAASPATAAYTITYQQVGSDIVATGAGSLNLGSVNAGGFGIGDPAFLNNGTYPGLAAGSVGASASTGRFVYYSNRNMTASGPSSFGKGFASTYNATGSYVAFTNSVYEGNYGFRISEGYVSGTDLGVSTATFTNTSFASLGLVPGSYTYTFGQGGSADSFTFRVVAPEAPVPELATWAMMMLGMGGVGYALRRRQEVATRVFYAA